jgi:hypothetical protein
MTIEAHDFIQNRTFDEIAIGDTDWSAPSAPKTSTCSR